MFFLAYFPERTLNKEPSPLNIYRPVSFLSVIEKFFKKSLKDHI